MPITKPWLAYEQWYFSFWTKATAIFRVLHESSSDSAGDSHSATPNQYSELLQRVEFIPGYKITRRFYLACTFYTRSDEFTDSVFQMHIGIYEVVNSQGNQTSLIVYAVMVPSKIFDG